MASKTPELDKIKNTRHRRFVLEYAAIGFKNQRIAAIAAGYKDGKAVTKTASVVALRVEVVAAINEQRTILLAKVEEELDMDAQAIMREMAIVAGSDISDYLTFDSDGVYIKDSRDITPHKLRAIKGVKIKSGKYGKDVELILHDKLKGTEVLAKAKGMYSDVDTSIKVELVITGRK
jgi:hypothetical protein